jgi:transcription initiation factor TFIID subunit 5
MLTVSQVDCHAKSIVSNSSEPLDKFTLVSSTGLLSSLLPRNTSLATFNSTSPKTLKLGSAPMTEKLKEQISRTMQDEEADGDVDMGDSAVKVEVLENGHAEDLISPGEDETNPPIPAVFRIADLKREVEAVKDKRKMIRLGPGVESEKASSEKAGFGLPSVVAFTMFDHGEG